VMLRLFAPFVPFVTEEVWSWWREGSVHRATWPTEQEILAQVGGQADATAEAALTQASEVTLAIRRERSAKKLSFGVSVRRVQLTEAVRENWPRVAADVLAGNNASTAEVTFGAEFAVEFAPPASPPVTS